jgi:hypothetical protein
MSKWTGRLFKKELAMRWSAKAFCSRWFYRSWLVMDWVVQKTAVFGNLKKRA